MDRARAAQICRRMNLNSIRKPFLTSQKRSSRLVCLLAPLSTPKPVLHMGRILEFAHALSEVDWVGQWKATCQPASANFSWFATCSWIDCECLWVGLAAPVATDELAPCFEEALLKDLLDQDSRLRVLNFGHSSGYDKQEQFRCLTLGNCLLAPLLPCFLCVFVFSMFACFPSTR